MLIRTEIYVVKRRHNVMVGSKMEFFIVISTSFNLIVAVDFLLASFTFLPLLLWLFY